ncbi:MAG TPA: hypothetical protein VL099_14955 [Candidatus Binatia bacterium]|nr:hypothetical protein [Candidatus Binatia bacterium]
MRKQPIHLLLSGGDRRSIGKSNRVVALVMRRPRTLVELMLCLWNRDPLVRMRAADAAEKISALRPGCLAPFKAELLGLAGEAIQPELRWHLARMLPRLPLNAPERDRAAARLREFLSDRSSIVRTMALQGLFELALGHPAREEEIGRLLETHSRVGSPAVKARSRLLLKQLASKTCAREKSASPRGNRQRPARG